MTKGIKRLFIGAIITVMMIVPAFSESEEDTEQRWAFNENAFGISFFVCPNQVIAGLNYQHWFDKVGVDYCLGGYYTDRLFFQTPAIDFCGSLKGQFKLFETKPNKPFLTKFYIWTLAGVNAEYISDDSSSGKRWGVNGLGGIGFGAELIFWQHMSIPLEFGIGGSGGSIPQSNGLGFSASSAIRFRF